MSPNGCLKVEELANGFGFLLDFNHQPIAGEAIHRKEGSVLFVAGFLLLFFLGGRGAGVPCNTNQQRAPSETNRPSHCCASK